MSPPVVTATCQRIASEVEKLTRAGFAPIVLCSPQIRPGLKLLTQSQLPRLVVLSYNEVTRDAQIESMGMVTDLVPAKAA
jgi:flagellar biosynthesis protein FlhA